MGYVKEVIGERVCLALLASLLSGVDESRK
jgi:hypothetical protein